MENTDVDLHNTVESIADSVARVRWDSRTPMSPTEVSEILKISIETLIDISSSEEYYDSISRLMLRVARVEVEDLINFTKRLRGRYQ